MIAALVLLAGLRVTATAVPQTALAPVTVQIVVRIAGGDPEDLWCAAAEWDMGDGSRSAHEADCPPYQVGDEPRRIYTRRWRYRGGGTFRPALTLRKGGRVVLRADVAVIVLDPLEAE